VKWTPAAGPEAEVEAGRPLQAERRVGRGGRHRQVTTSEKFSTGYKRYQEISPSAIFT
jgi:hypothetical protein